MDAMRCRAPAIALITCFAFWCAPGAAEAYPFLFVDAPRELPASRVAVSLESGYEHRGIRDALGDAAAYRSGIRWPLTTRLETIARIEARGNFSPATTSAELQARWTAGRSTGHTGLLSLSAGGRHEDTGITTFLASVAGSIPLGQSRVAMSVNLERPMSQERDEVDLLTSAGWMKSFGSRIGAGIELSGQDLEGFWSDEEAEGGASFLAGPTISMRGLGTPWVLSVAGGPVFHATNSSRVSGAPRPFPAGRNGYALRFALHLGEGD
jgi:hypothetical protein